MTAPPGAAFPMLPRGTHASGHDAAIVALLRWARSRARPFGAADLSEAGRFAMDSLVLNRYVACPDGAPIPQAWRTATFVVSAAGDAVLARADAADGETTAPAAKAA